MILFRSSFFAHCLRTLHDAAHILRTALCAAMATCCVTVSAQQAESSAVVSDTLSANTFHTQTAFNRNFSYVGLGFIASGFMMKERKRDFRELRHFFTPHYHKTFDNYTQYMPLVGTWALKAAGVEGRSSWRALAVSNALSFAIMGAVTNGMKYSVRELRPDGSARNSFPSGHTAFAFAAATVLHKEYGQTRSPLYSIAGYSLATVTGVGRVLNNRHWVSDVLVGAGIGIVSTDLGYFLADLIFKGKDTRRVPNGVSVFDVAAHPSFLSLGVELCTTPAKVRADGIFDHYDEHQRPFPSGDPRGTSNPLGLTFHMGIGSAVNVEGAYFFHPYFGVGGGLRAFSAPVTATADLSRGFRYYAPIDDKLIRRFEENVRLVGVESNRMAAFEYKAGAYFSYPLSRRVRLGAHATLGQRFTLPYQVDAILDINAKAIRKAVKETAPADTKLFATPEEKARLLQQIDAIGDGWNHRAADFLQVESSSALVYGTGLSCIWAYKVGVACRLTLNYDYSAPRFSYSIRNRWGVGQNRQIQPLTDTFHKRMHISNLSLGLGMCLLF